MQSFVEIKVRGYHIDHFHHVNHTRYLEFMEEGRWSYFEEKNLFHSFHEKGIIHAVVNININYKKSAKVGDVLIVATNLLKAGKNSFTMFQKLFLKGTDILVADAQVTNVFIDMNAGKVVPVDNEIISLWPDLGEYYHKVPVFPSIACSQNETGTFFS